MRICICICISVMIHFYAMKYQYISINVSTSIIRALYRVHIIESTSYMCVCVKHERIITMMRTIPYIINIISHKIRKSEFSVFILYNYVQFIRIIE